MQTNAVVFDLGGVLIDWDPRYLFRKLFSEEADVEWFLEEICPPAWNVMQDAGRPIAEAVAEQSARFPDHREQIAAYYGRWDEMLGGSLDETVAILSRLRDANIPLYALSNWSAETFPVAQQRFEFLGWFDGTIVSGQEGLIKPDPRIYDLLLSRFGLRAEEIVFIDDSPANVAGAADFGIHAIQFTSAETLESELRALGMLANG